MATSRKNAESTPEVKSEKVEEVETFEEYPDPSEPSEFETHVMKLTGHVNYLTKALGVKYPTSAELRANARDYEEDDNG